MEISSLTESDILLLKVAGKVDSNTSGEFEISLNEHIKENPEKIAADFSKVDYISSAGLRIILSLVKKVSRNKGKIVLFSLQPTLREIFEISGFTKVIALAEDKESAIKMLQS